MKSLFCTLCVSVATIHALPAAEAEWKPLFKSNDLSGWINVNCAPDTWTIKDGVIACTGKPTGALRTERQYENFELELEWRHMKPGGNAGIFIWASALPAAGVPFLRSIEVQVLDNGYDEKGKNEFYTTHGDVFPIHGATMTPMRPQTHKGDRCFPSEERSKSSPEWNHYRIVANNGSIRLSVNGKEVSGGDKCNWRKGYLGLESEGSPTEWRNIKLKELPATGATPEQSAPVAAGWRSLYNGVDLRGWKADGIPWAPFLSRKPPLDTEPPAWTPADWTIQCDDSARTLNALWTEEEFGDFELIIDRKPGAPGKSIFHGVAIRSQTAKPLPMGGESDKWQRCLVTISRGQARVSGGDGKLIVEEPLPAGSPTRGPLGLIAENGTSFANIFIRDVK